MLSPGSPDSAQWRQLGPPLLRQRTDPRSVVDLDGALEERAAAPETVLFEGQHLLWKARHRLLLKVTNSAHGAIVVSGSLLGEELETGLDPLFLDVGFLTKCVEALVEEGVAKEVKTKEVRGDVKVSLHDKAAIRKPLLHAALATFVLRRVCLEPLGDAWAPSGAESELGTLQLSLKPLAADSFDQTDVILRANPGCAVRRQSSGRRPSLADFQGVSQKMDVDRMMAAASRQSSGDLRTTTMNGLKSYMHTFQAAGAAKGAGGAVPFAQMAPTAQWRHLLTVFAHRSAVEQMRLRIEVSPACLAWEREHLAANLEPEHLTVNPRATL